MALSENQEKATLHSNKLPDFVYLTADVGSVFDSQVVSLLRSYHLQNQFRSIHLVCGIRFENEKERVRTAVNGYRINVLFFKSYPNFFFYHKAQQSQIAAALSQLASDIENPIVHIRGELLALHANAPLMNIWGSLNRVLVDIRGAGWEEVLEFLNMPLPFRLFKKINYSRAFAQLHKFGAVSVVSEALRVYTNKRCSSLIRPIHLVPCLVSERFAILPQARERVRKELHISEDAKLLVFSSGGNAGWQQNELLMELVSDRWMILNLSNTPIEVEGVINRFVPYAEMPDYLSAADAAIVFRSQSVVNKVACPVKFCEYLCSGLPVIANPTVELIKATLEEHKFGLLISHPSDLYKFPDDAIFNHNREKIAKFGKHNFGIETVAEKYKTIYSSLV
jgi:hypothetical protein